MPPTNGNRHDITQLTPLPDAIPRIRGVQGRSRHRPRRLFADRGYHDYDYDYDYDYDHDKYRRLHTHQVNPHWSRSRQAGQLSAKWALQQIQRARRPYGDRHSLHRD